MRSMLTRFAFLTVATLLPPGCQTSDVAGERAPRPVATYDDLGTTHRAITTTSPAAQRAFDQGLVLLWGFNHDDAIVCFGEAARLDPEAAMPWWGIALANGPHINNPAVDEAHARAAWEALEEARDREDGASAVERELIEALGARYSDDLQAPRAELDAAYAEAMGRVWRAHPDDADIGTWYAEALMDLHPWDLWTIEHAGKPWTPEIVAALEAALALDPDHVGACHLYIHALEASPYPERAFPAAERLGGLQEGAGHLVHMPAHIDARLGRWAEACDANRRAIAADEKHAQRFPRDGFYRVYMAHNRHFLAWASMMLGDSQGALASARAMVAGVPPEFVERMSLVIDGYMPVVLHAQVRFGRWDEVLATPPFPEELKVCNAVRHYARGVAFTARGQLAEAEAELAAFDGVVATIEDERPIGNNPAKTVLKVPRALLVGELAVRRGELEAGLSSLGQAVVLQDALAYDEAPDWMMPSRHALGAALLQAERWSQAEQVFRADLVQYPNNGWSLFGLQRALAGRGADAQAAQAADEFARAWKHADVKLTSPCFCQAGS